MGAPDLPGVYRTADRYQWVAMSLHIPQRPAWTCAGCGDAWPCATRRGQLTAEYAGLRTGLILYLAACMVDAAYDLPQLPGGSLFDRFLGWTDTALRADPDRADPQGRQTPATAVRRRR